MIKMFSVQPSSKAHEDLYPYLERSAPISSVLWEPQKKESLKFREKSQKKKHAVSCTEGIMCPWVPITALDSILI